MSTLVGRELCNPKEPGPNISSPPTAQSWVADGRAYISFWRRGIPPIPRREALDTSRPFAVREMCMLQWIRSGYEYLAFTPRFIPDYENALLAPLAIGPKVKVEEIPNVEHKQFGKPLPSPVETGSSTQDIQPEPHLPLKRTVLNIDTTLFKLPPSHMQAWIDFEALLLHVVRLLLARHGDTNIRLPPRPRSDTLQCSFDSQEAAVRNIFRIRNKFFPWFGLLSYLVARLDSITTYEMKSKKLEKWQVWKGTLLIAGIPPSTLDLFETSVLASHDPKYPRIGTIVDLQVDPQTFHAFMMSRKGVPIIYTVRLDCLDQLPLPCHHGPFIQEFRRTINPSGSPQDMEAWIRAQIPSDIVECFGMDQDPNYFDDSDVQAFPPLDPNSRQREFETRESFFACEALEDARTLACESEISKNQRLERETLMKTYNEPESAHVFLWVQEGIYEVRRRIPHSSVSDIWDGFPHENMRWNSFRNEWDLWYDRSPALRPDLDDEDDFEEPNGQGDNEDTDYLPSLEDTINKYIDFSLQSYLSNAVKFPMAESTAERSREFGLCRAMKEYFGLNTEADLPTMPPQVLKKHEAIFGKPNRLATLLLDSSVLDGPSKPTHSHLERIFCMTAFYAARSKIPPPFLSDLNNVHISNIGNHHISVSRTPFLAQLINNKEFPPKPLYSVQILDELNDPIHDSYGRRIFVWSATIALAIKRLSPARSRSIGHVAEALIGNGSGFIIAVPLKSLDVPPLRPRVPPLGRRFRNYIPDASDFALYRARCADLLSVRRLHRALRCGGILGRIARDFLSLYEGIDGPMDDALHEPMIISSSRSDDNVEFVEDGFSLEEVRILIGAFESRDDEGKNKPAYYSFWPPPWIWDNSGYNLGYWAPDCEAWYTAKRTEYLAGEGDTLLSVNQWAQKLRRFGDTVSIAMTMENHCSDLIDGNILY